MGTRAGGYVMPRFKSSDTWMPPDLEADPGDARPYPAGWRVRLPREDLDLIVRPLLPNQENRRPAGQAGPDIPYWEGAVRIEAAGSGPAGVPPGRGFVELTGYRSEVAVGGLGPDTIGDSSDAPEGRQDTMMDGLMDGITFIFRWLHIFVGIIWIGHLYFFNFVNGQMTAKLDGATKQKVVPELMPRALYWFRWGAAWTWITGVVLLLLVFWHGGLMFDPGDGWGGGAIGMVVITFLGVFVYDALWNSGLKSNVRAATIVSFLLLAVAVFLFVNVGAFTPRAVLIHTGAMFGTMMAFNVWFRIWPAQQRIIAAVKAGEAPAAADPALAGLRSKHNTYMSLPLLWAMANEHATPFFGGNFGIPGDYYWVAWLLIVVIGWHVIFQLLPDRRPRLRNVGGTRPGSAGARRSRTGRGPFRPLPVAVTGFSFAHRVSVGRVWRSLVAVTALLSACDSSPDEAVFPNRAIEIVSWATPGGPSDLLARALAEAAPDHFDGERVSVMTRQGGAGAAGMQYLRSRAGDPHVLGRVHGERNGEHGDRPHPFRARRFHPHPEDPGGSLPRRGAGGQPVPDPGRPLRSGPVATGRGLDVRVRGGIRALSRLPATAGGRR